MYNYLKDNYEVTLSDFTYNFMRHFAVCVFRAPNGQLYMIDEDGVPGTIINITKGTTLYRLHHDTIYLFHSMPIANSFVLFVTSNGKGIVIQVVDVIKEKTYTKKYSIRKIIETMLNISKGNDAFIKSMKFIAIGDSVDFDTKITSYINRDSSSLVFYDRYMVTISLSFEDTKTGDRKKLKDALSIIATYQNNELTVSLQINSNIQVESDFYSYNVDFGSVMVLINNKYKLDNKHDISKSHLYSVLVSAGDYTIISEPNINYLRIVVYYKNEPSFISSDSHFIIDNWGDILFVKAFNKRLVFVNKNRLSNTNKINKYYIEYNNSGISIVDNKVVRYLLLNSLTKNDNTDWVSMNMIDVAKYISLEDKLEEIVRHYACRDDSFTIFLYSYYIDYDEGELYALIYFQCTEIAEDNKLRLYLFRCKIGYLLNGSGSYRLVSQFEFDIGDPANDIYNILHNREITGNYRKILRPLIKKWSTGNEFIGLTVFKIYDKSSAYYDYKYNRRSIKASPIDTSIDCDLHLSRHILPVF